MSTWNRPYAEKGIPEMMVSLAYDLEYGMNGEDKNIDEAIKWYEKAGDAESIKRAKALRERD